MQMNRGAARLQMGRCKGHRVQENRWRDGDEEQHSCLLCSSTVLSVHNQASVLQSRLEL